MSKRRSARVAGWGILWAVFAVTWLSGCSKHPQENRAANEPQTRAEASANVDPCGGLTAAQAAAILNIPVTDVDGPRTSNVISCEYQSKTHPYTRISFNIYPEASAEVAAQKLQSTCEGFKFLSPIKPVANLGDEAYRAPDSRLRRLLMRKGRVWLDVVTPGDEASQIKIAQIVLKHLP